MRTLDEALAYDRKLILQIGELERKRELVAVEISQLSQARYPIVTDTHLLTNEQDGGYDPDYSYTEVYGYRILKATKRNFILNGQIVLDGHLISDTTGYEGLLENEGRIPSLYVVRKQVNDPTLGKFGEFVCGLDLLDDGRYWVGLGEDSRFDTMNEAMEFIKSKLNTEFYVELEGEMRI